MVIDYSFPKLTRLGGTHPHTVRCRLPDPALLSGPMKARLAFLFAVLVSIATIPCFLKRQNVQVVNVHYLTPAAWIFALLRRLGILRSRLIVSLHGTDLGVVQGRSLPERMGIQVLTAADLIVTPSHALRTSLLETRPQYANKTHVVHNGIDPDRIAHAVAEGDATCAEPSGRRSIVALGTFSRGKGHDLLIRAFASIATTHPDVDLMIAGKSGPSLAQTRQLVTELGLESRIRTVEDAPHAAAMRLLARASLFVQPSRQEAFGIAILEAGVLGVPVIATRVGGIPEIISDRENGRLVEPEDADALSAALIELLDDPGLGQQYAHALRERVMSDFLWGNAHERYLRLAGAEGRHL